MSRGSVFTLYRKYTLCKMDDNEFEKVLKIHEDAYKNYGNVNLNKHGLPAILSIKKFKLTDPRKVNNINWQRKQYNNYVASADHCLCDTLLSWSFNSSFDQFIEHWNMGFCCSDSRSSILIDKETAEKILQAASYLYNEKWDDNIAKAMNNEFINVLAEGGNCNSYWKYVNRNKNKSTKQLKFSQNGYEVVVKLPKTVNKDDDDENFDNNNDETFNYQFKCLITIMSAYLNNDVNDFSGSTELILEYSTWG